MVRRPVGMRRCHDLRGRAHPADVAHVRRALSGCRGAVIRLHLIVNGMLQVVGELPEGLLRHFSCKREISCIRLRRTDLQQIFIKDTLDRLVQDGI